MNTPVSMDFAIVQGAELIRSAHLDPDQDTVRTALEKEPVDGALIISIQGSDFLDENMWDSLDLILTGLIHAIQKLENSASNAQVEFPDTRAELAMTKTSDNSLDICIEGQHATCNFGDFVLATEQVTRNFLHLVEKSTVERLSTLETLSDFLVR